MYAIINVTLQTTQFYTSFASASEACSQYNVLPGHVVYIVNFSESEIEQL